MCDKNRLEKVRKSRLSKVSKTGPKKLSKKGLTVVIIYIIYITFIVLSRVPFLAEYYVGSEMKDSYEYRLSFLTDGKHSHYEVLRNNQSTPGYIYVKYYPTNNSLIVRTINIRELGIDCRSMYEDEYKEVFGLDSYDNSNYYKWYFIEKDHLIVHITSDNKISQLEFKDTPMPHTVRVNGENWVVDVNYSYNNNYGTIISEVPTGHSWVDLYFKSPETNCPVAKVIVNNNEVEVFEQISFDGTGSYDPDGRIDNYFWDFGDGTFVSGADKVFHHYSEIGTYGVILTVRDDDELIDRDYVNLTVNPLKSTDDVPKIKEKIPDQHYTEDCDPWELVLNDYESIKEVDTNPLNWWVTGVNESLITVLGENSTDDTLIFSPEANAFGSNQITVYLGDNGGIRDYQSIWINITSVNDPPTIYGAPDLVIRYEQVYPFNYQPYVDDIETPNDELVILSSGSKYAEVVDGLIINFKYPKSMFGETDFVLLTVYDGEDTCEDIIAVTVSDDWVPILAKPLPDVYLTEGEIAYNYFDLDDYYSDPDGDALFYSYGYSHIYITINENHSVDFTAPKNWWGREIVTFRATDPAGAKTEDIIIVTIEPINDAPIITGVPNLVVHYEEPYQFDLFPYIYDEDNAMEELIITLTERKSGIWIDSQETNYIQVASDNNLGLLINYPKSYLERTVLVNITVSDGELSGSQLITVWITSNYPPKLVQLLPDVVFLEDTQSINAIDLKNYFFDQDYDDLYFSYGEVKINVTINNGLVDLSAESNWYGSEYVTFRATDPSPYEALAEDTILITVLPVNDPPVVDIIPTQRNNVGETWILDLTEFIHDIDTDIKDINITVETDGIDCRIRGKELIFYGTRELKSMITVYVSDGDNSVSQTALVIINQPAEKEIDLITINIIGLLLMIILMSISIVAYRRYKSHYIVEEVFLIQKSGELVCHVTRERETQVDEDILSGMFTAVQIFIKDSFGKGKRSESDDDWALEELKVGKNKILITRGRFVYLTIIFSGSYLAGSKLRIQTKKLLNKIEEEYQPVLEKWTGDMSRVEGIDDFLIKLIDIKNIQKNN